MDEQGQRRQILENQHAEHKSSVAATDFALIGKLLQFCRGRRHGDRTADENCCLKVLACHDEPDIHQRHH